MLFAFNGLASLIAKNLYEYSEWHPNYTSHLVRYSGILGHAAKWRALVVPTESALITMLSTITFLAFFSSKRFFTTQFVPSNAGYWFLLVAGLSWIPCEALAQAPRTSLSTREAIEAEFAAVPCRNKERLPAVKALFEKMNAPAADISTDKFRNVENLVVKIPGVSSETIVIGAHYDLADRGCGAIDNWSGIVAIAHLYRTIHQ